MMGCCNNCKQGADVTNAPLGAFCGDDERVAVILIGAPGSGKGTLASSLMDSFGFESFSPGNMFRDEISKGTPLGLKIKAICDSGQLVSDDIVVEMVGEFLTANNNNRVIFDGFPRTSLQAEKLSELLSDWMTYVVCLDVNDEVVASRLLSRYSCKTCSKVYNEKTAFPKNGGVCDVCGGGIFVHRSDDTDDAIFNRLQVYHEKVAGIIDYYSSKGTVYRVDASQSTENVLAEVVGIVFE
jgi:adenylate kinase